MASLGDLVVNLTANSAGLSSGLKAAQNSLNMFGAAVTAMAGASIARFVQVGSGFDDMAQRTGMSVEALSSLQHVAKMSDTSLEALQGSFLKLAKFMGEVREGSKGASQALAALGISSTQMLAATPEQQFKLIADAIKALPDASQQAAAAMSIFGKSAGEILPTLRLGSAGISELQQQALDLGLVMTGQTAEAAAKAGDAIDTLISTVNAAAVAFGANFAEPLTIAASMLAKMVSENRTLVSVLAVAVVAMYGVAKAIQVMTIAETALSKAKAIGLALSGPKGWAILAAGAVAGAVAVSVLTKSYRDSNAELQKNLELQAQAKGGPGGGGGAAPAPQKSVLDVRAERLQALQDSFNSLNSQSAQAQAEALRRKIAQLTDDFNTLRKLGRTDMTPEQFQQYKQAAIDAFTGVGEATQKLQAELAILRGETTAQEQELARLAAAGANDAQIQMLRQMQAERDKIIKQQEEQRKKESEVAAAAAATESALKAAAEAAQSEAEAIKESLKTPEQKLKEQVARIKQLEKQGLLTAEQSKAAQAKATAESKTGGGAVSQEPRFATAAMRGSGEAFSTILRGMGRKDPVVAATEKQTKELAAAIKQNKPEFVVAEGA